MNPMIQLKQTTAVFLIAFGFACFGLSPGAQAVSPAPDGGYPGGNTAEGHNALFSLTSGTFNTAVGSLSLQSNTTGQLNTAVGAATLFVNAGSQNTATGAAALLGNTVGLQNTASGSFALANNTEGSDNTANGALALLSNTTANNNTAYGAQALQSNTTGADNTAIGDTTLLNNTTGFNNVALGSSAGFNQTTGSNNVYIGFGVTGVAGENSACYIASIYGQSISPATGIAVVVDSNNKLGTMVSSKRFKSDIKPMDKASEALFSLKPVSFHYNKKIDPKGTSQFGLVAEDVEKVNPDLIVRDKDGKPYSVRYDQVNAMLLNEFLKEHRKVEQQRKDFEAALAKQQKQIETLTAGLQRVSGQLAAASPSLADLK
jgi:hypothetical protein